MRVSLKALKTGFKCLFKGFKDPSKTLNVRTLKALNVKTLKALKTGFECLFKGSKDPSKALNIRTLEALRILQRL